MQHIFIIGSKGIPASYGGFETFVDKLTYYNKNDNIKYHVACMGGDGEFEYNHAHCFNIKVPHMGSAKAVYYDIAALKYCIRYIERKRLTNAIIYVLACRIGPFIAGYKKKIHELGGRLYINPDGHEWKRAKWNWIIRRYWKWSEELMVKYSDLMICDSQNIEGYIKEQYRRYSPRTTFIAYGAELLPSNLADDDSKLMEWYKKKSVRPLEYYLIVGRFVPENNFETMLREFLHSKTPKDLVVVTGVENKKLYQQLAKIPGFSEDSRIKFTGTVYDQDLLKKIRENAFAYIHGHEVGGTNPSLLEALGSTKLNLLLDIGFNREVAEDGALYWSKDRGNLASLINEINDMSGQKVAEMGVKARKRIVENYTWEAIVKKYEEVWEAV